MMQYASLFLLNGLTEKELETCRRLAVTEEKTYSKGDKIYTPQQSQKALAIVLDGHVRVWQGRVPMNDLLSGDVFGVAALFGTDEDYPSTVVAQSDCRVLFIPQETVVTWMREVPTVAQNYVGFLSDRIRFLNCSIIFSFLRTKRRKSNVNANGGFVNSFEKLVCFLDGERKVC